jgi:catechol 2,3-dioxygenase-like lactoylglutathione lyase family enzyme
MSNDGKSAFAGRIGGIDHLTLPVHDLEEAERFYVGVLGAEVLMRVTREMLASLGRPPEEAARAVHTSIRLGNGPQLDLFPQDYGWPQATQPHPHIAFRVKPEDMLALQKVLEDHGVPTDGPRRLGPPGHASVYFYDPSGNHLEITCMGFSTDIPVGAPDLAGLARRAGRA